MICRSACARHGCVYLLSGMQMPTFTSDPPGGVISSAVLQPGKGFRSRGSMQSRHG